MSYFVKGGDRQGSCFDYVPLIRWRNMTLERIKLFNYRVN